MYLKGRLYIGLPSQQQQAPLGVRYLGLRMLFACNKQSLSAYTTNFPEYPVSLGWYMHLVPNTLHASQVVLSHTNN